MTQRKRPKCRFSPEFKLEAIESVVKYQQRAVNVALEWDRRQLRKRIGHSMKRKYGVPQRLA